MPATPDPLEPALDRLSTDRDGAMARWFEWLRIPSVSAQPAHAEDCRRAAVWLAQQLRDLGFSVDLVETPGHPVVLAHHPGPGKGADIRAGAGAPHLLYYGHYDVQPAEPLDLWTSPPFEPRLVDHPLGPRVVARGAVDDKGQVMLWLEALRAWTAAHGAPPVPVTVLVEGEEEVGSPNLDAVLIAQRDSLRADVAVISDTNMWDRGAPAITTRLRGLAYTELRLRGASRDLHSGLFGGSALNAANLLARILGGLHDAEGRVAIPDFYAGVIDPSEAELASWAALGFDEAAFLSKIGLSHPAGERDKSALERLWGRPTADVNGLWGGYAGPGSKTVIPAEAGAKVSFRLVPGQNPEAVVQAYRRYVDGLLPPDARAEIELFGMAPGIAIPTESRTVRAAQDALQAEFGRPAVLIGSGGSIPVVESLRRLLGLDTLLMGFGLDDDQVHSPDEKFDLACFASGTRAHARLLGQFAR